MKFDHEIFLIKMSSDRYVVHCKNNAGMNFDEFLKYIEHIMEIIGIDYSIDVVCNTNLSPTQNISDPENCSICVDIELKYISVFLDVSVQKYDEYQIPKIKMIR